MILTLDTFEKKFYLDGNPYWRAFEGKNTSKTAYAQNMSIENMDESWQLMQDTVFGICDGGTVTINTKRTPQSRDALSMTVSWGNGQAAIGSLQPGPSAGNGFGMGIAGMQQILGFTQDLVKQQMTPQLEMIRKEYEITRLQERVKELEEGEPASAKDMVIEGIVSKLPDLIDAFLGRRQAAPAIGVLGAGTQVHPPEEGEENEPLKRRSVDLNAVVNAAQVLQQVFPQYDVSVLLINLANYCQNNPSQAQMVIKMIMP